MAMISVQYLRLWVHNSSNVECTAGSCLAAVVADCCESIGSERLSHQKQRWHFCRSPVKDVAEVWPNLPSFAGQSTSPTGQPWP